jgi:hypothetical protein
VRGLARRQRKYAAVAVMANKMTRTNGASPGE